jgi:DNA-binding XRE family transcriptional regulator
MNFKDFISRTDRTHDQIAQQLGCSRATITSIAIGRRKPSLSLCRRILIVSGGQVTADELISEFGSDD